MDSIRLEPEVNPQDFNLMLPTAEKSEGCTVSLPRNKKDATNWEIIKIHKIILKANQNISAYPHNYYF